MGANATQGVAVLAFLTAFSCLAGAFFDDGNLLFLLLFVIGAAASIGLFQKAKRLEHAQK